MESVDGDYWYTSHGSAEVCGLYLIGLADQVIEIQFHQFNIDDCENHNVLAVSKLSNDIHISISCSSQSE